LKRVRSLMVVLGAGALAFACRTSVGAAPTRDVAPFPRIPAQNVEGAVAVEARYYLDHKRFFGAELPREARVLPIALKLGLAQGESGSLRFDPAAAALRLYLPDGSVLASVQPAELATPFKHVNDALKSSALDARVLPAWSAATQANVYFDLGEAGEYFVKRGEVSRRVGDELRTWRLEQALIGFEIEAGGAPRSVFVGIAPSTGARSK